MRITHRFLLSAILLPLVILTVVAAVLLWPQHRKYAGASNLGANVQLVNATALAVSTASCQGDPSNNLCQTASIEVTSGPDKNTRISLVMQQGPGQPVLHHNDKLVLGRSPGTGGAPATYYFSDFQRKVPLLIIALVFAVLVVLVGRWRGVGALAGLIFTWLTVTNFILPAVLNGKSPLLVALTGGAAIVIVVLYIAHGFNPRTTIALIGTLLSLALTGVLAYVAVKLTHLTGLSSEEATYVQNFAGQVNLQGLVLGGIVIGSLGVLNDMTVTQASTVWEIHLAEPTRSRKQVYGSAIRVGRDHIASTVYTLVLAYTGAALPLLVLFTIAQRSFTDVVGTDVVAEEVVRTLVGSIGLMLSVPLTTALAALTIKNSRADKVVQVIATEGVVTVVELDEGVAPIAATSEAAEPEKAATEAADAPTVTVAPGKRRGLFRRRPPTFDRKMSRRERKFWDND